MRRAGILVAVALVAPRVAHADRVAVTVVDVAGDAAYVEPGAAAGLAVGATITLGDVALPIVAVNSTSATIALHGAHVAIGARGTADVAPGQVGVAAVARKPAPRPADAYRAQWPDVVRPAEIEPVRHVPLGDPTPEGRVHLAVIGRGYASGMLARTVTTDGGGTTTQPSATAAQAEARVIASFDVLTDRPLAADVDVGARAFSDGYDKHAQTPVLVRALQLRYGDAVDPRYALGRLRYAASSVGMLDGGRAMLRTGSLELAAFGGLVPDPVSGKPDTSASRFGGEASYDLATIPWQPRVSVTAVGSTWSGKLDERRLAVAASAAHGGVYVDGWAEGQAFSAGNPWGARAVELVGAGANAEWRAGGEHAGVGLSFLRPERSLRLAAALPADWLCAAEPQPGDTAEACRGSDYWATASASGGLRRGWFSLDGTAAVGRTHGVTVATTSSAYVRAEARIDGYRAILAATAGRSEAGSWTGGELGGGAALARQLDGELRYRAELLDYRASTGPALVHAVAADLRYAPSHALDLAVSALATTGADRTSFALLTTLAWRPLP